MAVLATALDSFRSYVGSFTWAPFVAFSKTALLSQLSKIQVGQLLVTDEKGKVTVCGAPGIKDGSPRTELQVVKEAFWVRVVLFADMVSAVVPFGEIAGSAKGTLTVLVDRALRRALCWGRYRVRISLRSFG